VDQFCFRQFEECEGFDPQYKGTRIPKTWSRQEFEKVVNAYYAENGGADCLVDGYAPFCKHIFMPNFVAGVTVPVAEITEDNEHLLRTGYTARKPTELPVLGRWFPKGRVPEVEAAYLDLILYSREQIRKENAATGIKTLDTDAPWGIISVKAQMEPYETPMQPITVMRNSMISEGGSGVDIDRDAYMRSVKYWESRATIA